MLFAARQFICTFSKAWLVWLTSPSKKPLFNVVRAFGLLLDV
jgi:hypothetical protein